MTNHPMSLQLVTKRFGGFTAVKDLSFDVPEGQIIGFLGPNGAGKSTSLRLALGVMNPDEGHAHIFGGPPNRKSLQRIGFLPEERGLYKKMTPRSTISYFAQLKGLSAREGNKRADALLKNADLDRFARSKNSKLSKGMAQKVQILSTLVHQPDFLILDEPFSGLDPVNQQILEDLIISEHKRGATILFSTHVMEHAERLCDSIVMMAGGKKVFDGNLEQAYQILDGGARLGARDGFDVGAALAETDFNLERLEDDDSGTVWWHAALTQGQNAQDLLRVAIEKGVPVTGIMPDEARLRDVFVKLAGPKAAKALSESNNVPEAV